MKKLIFILLAIFIVNLVNAGKPSENSSFTASSISSEKPLTNKDALTTYIVFVYQVPSYGCYVYGGGQFNANQSCTVYALTGYGFVFTGWTENGIIVSTDSIYTFTVTANRSLVAQFLGIQLIINTMQNPANGGTTTGGGTINYYQVCTVSAIPDTGYTFINWTENGTILSTSSNYGFLATSDHNLVANFSANPLTINTTTYPVNTGSVTGGGNFIAGQTCTLNASGNSNCTFANWTENGNIVSTSAIYQFTVTNTRNLCANFNMGNTNVTTSSIPLNGGSTNGGGIFNFHQYCTVNASPSSGYTFANWTEDEEVVSFDSIFSFNVDSNMNLVAHFTTNPFTISTTSSPANGGSCVGNGIYAPNQFCLLLVKPNPGFSFVNLTENGNIISTYIYNYLTVTSNMNLVANFTPLPCSAYFTLVPDSMLLHHYFIIPNATGIAPFNYSWNWGDGTFDSIAYPSHTYAASGNYNISLHITDAVGCTSAYSYYASLQKSTDNIISIDVIQESVGLLPEKTSDKIRIYPNPAKDNISIESNSNSKQRLDIVNLIGQTVYSAYIYGKTTVDVSTFSRGIYFLRLNTMNETVVKKFVKE
jgi:hypothetical protein